MPVCYLNGSIVPLEDAKVGVYDIGLLRGFGIYEGIAAMSGEPFHFHDHYERFRKGAEALGLSLPHTENEMLAIVRDVLRENTLSHSRANIRVILTGGPAIGGIDFNPETPTFIVLTEKHEPLPETLYTHGASILTSEHCRHIPECKTVDYIAAVILQKKRKEAGALEVLYTHEGKILECTTCNIFMVKDGVLITPKDRILGGITRKVVLELTDGLYPTEVRAVSVAELFAADEVFLTSSFKDIVPVVTVDQKQISNGLVGPVTRDLMKRFESQLGS